MSSITKDIPGRTKSIGEYIFDFVVAFLLLSFCLVIVLPLLHIISASFSDPFELLLGKVGIWPVKPTLSLYRMVFKNPEIWRSYGNTLLYTTLGTAISVFLTLTAAYPLSRKELYGRRWIQLFYIFTMFFSGGMIPSYILVTSILDIDNTIWAIVLPSAMSTYNMIVARNFLEQTVPDEVIESASIDGCNDIRIFRQIVLPISLPIIAVMALFYGVGHWNQWFNAMLYVQQRSLYPLQMILREILLQNDVSNMTGAMNTSDKEMVGAGIKYATMVVSTLPIMLLYPFLQKYFVQGMTIGAVKG